MMDFFNQYSRPALYIFLIYLPFTGTVTYWFAGGNPWFQALTKDIFYLIGLFGILQLWWQDRLFLRSAKPLVIPLGILLGTCAVTLVLVNGYQQGSAQTEQPLLMGLIGFKAIFWYIPLLLCGYRLIRDKQELFLLIRLHILLVLICCGLGLMQYFLLVTGVCQGTRGFATTEILSASLQAQCLVGGPLIFSPELGLVRLPGTFATPGQWGWFLTANSFLVFAAAMSDRAPRWQLGSWLALFCILLSAVLEGHRMVLVFLPPIALILFFVASSSSLVKRFLWLGTGMVVLLILWFMTPHLDTSIWNAILPSPPQILPETPRLLGQGLGRATPAAALFGQTWPIETYYPKVLYELGLFGFIGMLALLSTMSFLTFQAYRSTGGPQGEPLRDRRLRRLGVCIWAFILLVSYTPYDSPLDGDPVAIYYWFFAGILFKLPELDIAWD